MFVQIEIPDTTTCPDCHTNAGLTYSLYLNGSTEWQCKCGGGLKSGEMPFRLVSHDLTGHIGTVRLLRELATTYAKQIIPEPSDPFKVDSELLAYEPEEQLSNNEEDV